MEERNEIMETNNNEEVREYDGTETSEGGGLGKVLIGLGVGVCVGVGALVYKNKSKIEAKRIEKLRKKGYVIYHESEIEEVVQVDEDEDSEEIIEKKVNEIKDKKKEKEN